MKSGTSGLVSSILVAGILLCSFSSASVAQEEAEPSSMSSKSEPTASQFTSSVSSQCQPITLMQQPAQEDDLQVNALKLGRYFVSQSLDSYYSNNRMLLPVNQVVDLLGLTLARNENTLTLSHDDLSCELNIELQQANETAELAQLQWTSDEYGTYIDVAVLETLFSGRASIDFSQQLIVINTELDFKPVSFQPKQTTSAFFSLQPEYVIDDQYHLSTFPSVDLNTTYRYDDASSESRYDARLNAYFDLLYQGTELRINESDGADARRLKLFRNFRVGDNNAALSQVGYELGDIFTSQDNLIASTNLGQGLHIFSGEKNQFNAFDSISFRETVAPGWRGELYRNGQLVATQSANNENQLIFTNVPTFFGFNQYELRLFGPDGQKETRLKSYQVGRDQVSDGKFNFDISSIEPGKYFIDDDPTTSQLYSRADKIALAYGVNSDLSAGLSWQALENASDEEVTEYVKATINQQVGFGAINFEYAQQADAGFGLFGGFSGYIFDKYNVSLDYSRFSDFTSQIHTDSSDLNSQVRARISGSSALLGGFGWSSSLTQQFNETSDDNFQAQFSATKSISKGALSSTFNYNERDGSRRIFNNIYWVRNFKPVSLSVGLNWYPFDDFDVQSSTIEARWASRSQLFQISRLLYQPNSDNEYRFNHQLNWRTRHFTFTSGVTVNDNGDWEVNAGFVTSIGYDYVRKQPSFSHKRSANTGNLHLLAYLDKDRNAILSQGDEPLPNVKFAGNSDWRHTETDDYGQAILTGASASGQQKVAIDLASLQDPFLYPRYEKLSVKSHPGGLNRIMLPVLSYSDLEGSLYVVEDSITRGVLGVPIQLVREDERVVATVSTESDGYYAFSKVAPGRYQVRVEPTYLAQQDWQLKGELQSVTAPEEGDVIWLPDLVYQKAATSSSRQNSQPVPQSDIVASNLQRAKVSALSAQEPLRNGYTIQVAALAKPESLKVVQAQLQALRNAHSRTQRTYFNRTNKLNYLTFGRFESAEQARNALKVYREQTTNNVLQAAFIAPLDKFMSFTESSGKLTQEAIASTALLPTNAVTVDTKQQRLQNAAFICQLASYQNKDSIDTKYIESSADLMMVRREVAFQTYYTVLLLPAKHSQRSDLAILREFCEQTIHKPTNTKGWWRTWPINY